MKPGTCTTLTSLLIFGLFTACILAQITPARVQAVFNLPQIDLYDGGISEEIPQSSESMKSSLNSYEGYENYRLQCEQISKSAVRMAYGVYQENVFYTEQMKAGIQKLQLLQSEETDQRLTVLLTGDLMCLGGQQRAVKKDGSYDFSGSFLQIASLLSQADLCIGNLETLISPSNPYTIDKKTVDGNPNCNAMESYLRAVSDAGFDAVATANNHCLDALKDGVVETISMLDQYELYHTGTYITKEYRQPLIFEQNGIVIALLSYTELINRRDALDAESVNTYVSCYSQKQVIKDVLAARKAGADIVIAYNHWGTENTHEVTKRQREHAYEMAQAGVDVIIGSHPHCLQPAEYITTSDGKRVLCMYSMGNFISSMTREINSDTIALQLIITKNEKVTMEAGYYAMKAVSHYGSDHYVLLLTESNQESESLNAALDKAQKRIQKVIGTEIEELIFQPEMNLTEKK